MDIKAHLLAFAICAGSSNTFADSLSITIPEVTINPPSDKLPAPDINWPHLGTFVESARIDIPPALRKDAQVQYTERGEILVTTDKFSILIDAEGKSIVRKANIVDITAAKAFFDNEQLRERFDSSYEYDDYRSMIYSSWKVATETAPEEYRKSLGEESRRLRSLLRQMSGDRKPIVRQVDGIAIRDISLSSFAENRKRECLASSEDMIEQAEMMDLVNEGLDDSVTVDYFVSKGETFENAEKKARELRMLAAANRDLVDKALVLEQKKKMIDLGGRGKDSGEVLPLNYPVEVTVGAAATGIAAAATGQAVLPAVGLYVLSKTGQSVGRQIGSYVNERGPEVMKEAEDRLRAAHCQGMNVLTCN